MLAIGHAPATADSGFPNIPGLPGLPKDSGPSPLQQWIDQHIPSPIAPAPVVKSPEPATDRPADSPGPRKLRPDISALWHSVLAAPSGDPLFDEWPRNLDALKPGEIVEWRDVTWPAALLVLVPIQRAVLLKYRTSDASGAPSFATATLVIPAAPWTGNGTRPVMVNALPINSLGRRCTPGYAMAHGFHSDFNGGDLFPPTTGWAASRGYAVLIPDHEGPWMSYAEPNVAGHAMLDAIRAVRAMLPDQFGESRYAMGGYSGGAIASYGAAMLVDEYAPELSKVLVGATMGGLATDYRKIAHRFNGNSASGILLAATLAIAREYPEILSRMNHLAQWVASSPFKDTCGTSNGPLGAIGLPIEVAANIANPLDGEIAETIYRQTNLTGRTSGTPLYVYHAAHDFWIPIEGADELFHTQCARGVPAVYRTEPGEHVIALGVGFGGAINWLDARLRGDTAPNECPVAPKETKPTGQQPIR
ncbi:lipase family protein [Nocardia sp. NPDC052566]|uniref:lipase family protein n=1 Tax=Nocardia sp. NPDC052566 TaxID=3364330 RepID=UPI0037CC378E